MERTKIVLSASRRTDIPAFYLDWFLSSLEKGMFEVRNPYSQRVKRLGFLNGDVHSIVFWSKNYGLLLGSKYALGKYNLFFHFTLNTSVPGLEPGVPPLDERLEQARALTRWRGTDTLMWRFDPVVVWEEGGKIRNNLSDFHTIARFLKKTGVHRLTLSVMDRYTKIDRRIRNLRGFRFVYPALSEAASMLEPLLHDALDMGFDVSLCCEKELISLLPSFPLKQGKCIDGELLTALFGAGADLSPDRGQRRNRGCGCTASFDVGSYSSQPCRNACLYCYANPARIVNHLP